MKQLFLALNFLHQKHMCHRNVKSENILCEPWNNQKDPIGPRIKLADFGFATDLELDQETTKMSLGNRKYMAPELINNPEKKAHNEKVDVWSAGVIAYVLLSNGSYPFPGSTKDQIDYAILNDEPDMTQLLSCTEDAKQFIQKCFVKNKDQRQSAYELL